MRLPWPFGRAQRSPSEGGDPDSGGAVAPAAGPAVERGPGDAWRRLPALAETMAPPPLVAPNRPFAAALASNEPPAPILAPLSHGRSLEAPRGLVAGVARPIEAARGAALPPAIQRSPLHSSRRGVALDEGAGLESEAEPAVPGAIERASVTAAPAPTTAAPEATALRRLEATTTRGPKPAASALTTAPEPSARRPLGLVGQPRATGAVIQRAPERAAAPTPPAAVTPAPSPAAPPAPRPAPELDRPRLTIGQARRLGLGTPIAGGPLGSAASTFTLPSAALHAPAVRTTSEAPAASVPATPIQRSPESSAAPEPTAPAQQTLPSAPTLPLASHGPALDAHAAAALDQPALPASGRAAQEQPVPARRNGPPSARSMAGTPIVSAQPLRARVQRAPLTLPSKAPDDAASVASATVTPATSGGSGGAPVQVHRDGNAAQLSKSLDARSFTHGGEIYLPASHGPLTSGKGRSLLAHELTHVTQQRRLGSSLPEEHTPHGKVLEAEAVAAEHRPDMPLAQPNAAPPAKAGLDQSAQPDLSSVPTHATQPGPSATGPAQRAPAQAGGAGPGAGDGSARKSHSEQELEDLANQLYSRIGRQLRRELLVDRERAGLAMDFR